MSREKDEQIGNAGMNLHLLGTRGYADIRSTGRHDRKVLFSLPGNQLQRCRVMGNNTPS